MKDKASKKNVKRIAIECIYRGLGRHREFTTPGNFEANNLLKNKLDKMRVVHQPGRLIFEFVPGELPEGSSRFLKGREIDSEICVCGHNRFAHASPGKFYPYRDACQVNSCSCRKYKERKAKKG